MTTHYRLGPVIGQLGGGHAPLIDVSLSRAGEEEVITTIDVPAGETWVVFWVGELDFQLGVAFSSSGSPRIWVGGQVGPAFSSRGQYSHFTMITEPSEVRMVANYTNPMTFSGVLLAGRMP